MWPERLSHACGSGRCSARPVWNALPRRLISGDRFSAWPPCHCPRPRGARARPMLWGIYVGGAVVVVYAVLLYILQTVCAGAAGAAAATLDTTVPSHGLQHPTRTRLQTRPCPVAARLGCPANPRRVLSIGLRFYHRPPPVSAPHPHPLPHLCTTTTAATAVSKRQLLGLPGRRRAVRS